MIARLLHDQRGGAAVEAAFVLPMLFGLLYGLMEFGRITWTSAAMNYAVQEAARCASVRPDVCGDDAKTKKFASDRLTALNLPAKDVVFTVSAPACGRQVRGEATYSYLLTRLAPGIPKVVAQVCRP